MDQETKILFDQFTKSKKCLDLQPHELEMKILGCMKTASDLAQKPLTEGQIKTYIIEMIRDLRRNWDWLTIAELEYLMKQGAKGEFHEEGKIFNLSYTTIYNWLVAYRNSEERRAYVEIRQKQIEDSRKALAPPPVKRIDFLKQMTITAWEIYSRSKEIDSFQLLPVEAFEYLESTGSISMSNDDKRKMRENVLQFLRNRANDKRSPMMAKDCFPFVLAGESDENNLKIACRKWAVAIHFQSLINAKKVFEI